MGASACVLEASVHLTLQCQGSVCHQLQWAPVDGHQMLHDAAVAPRLCVAGLFVPAGACPVGLLLQTGRLQKPQGLTASLLPETCRVLEI